MPWRRADVRELAARFGGYFLTGGAAAIVDLGGFAAIRAADVAIPVAATLSFLTAAVVNYVLTSRFVYRSGLTLGRWFSFLLFASVGLVVNVGVTTFVAATFAVPSVFAKLCGIGVAFVLNFALNHLIVFRRA